MSEAYKAVTNDSFTEGKTTFQRFVQEVVNLLDVTGNNSEDVNSLNAEVGTHKEDNVNEIETVLSSSSSTSVFIENASILIKAEIEKQFQFGDVLANVLLKYGVVVDDEDYFNFGGDNDDGDDDGGSERGLDNDEDDDGVEYDGDSDVLGYFDHHDDRAEDYGYEESNDDDWWSFLLFQYLIEVCVLKLTHVDVGLIIMKH
ncbi:hypothetical protein HDU76_002860 [Blyttiomyces sp. JEL0837]|nr:hypothetical protein HDU76_002860 [Blyttiomyces sp. JEL0837]